MKDKMTEEQAKLYAALLWEELCKPRHYGKRKKEQDIKESAIQTLIGQGVLPDLATEWDCLCPYCELWDAGECHECPMQQFADEYEYVACAQYGPYEHWSDHPCPEAARAMADFCWSVYRGQDGGDKERKACACCKDDKPKAVRFEVGDRVKLLDESVGREVDPMWTYPKWNNTRVGGTVEDFNGIGGNPRVRWDNGHLSCFYRDYIRPLTSAERLMLAQRPIRPGDVFKYWHDSELCTLAAVDDGCDDNDTFFVELGGSEAVKITHCFDRAASNRGEDGYAEGGGSKGYDVYFERLVPVGRVTWSVEPKA